jgi:hypothetical protein
MTVLSEANLRLKIEAVQKLRVPIEAAVRSLRILPGQRWRVRRIVNELCWRGALYAETGGGWMCGPHMRPATREMVKRELAELLDRALCLADKIERKGGTTRAREQLARRIQVLHAPTLTALTPRIDSEEILDLVDTLPMKLLSRCDLSATEMRYWAFRASAALAEMERTVRKVDIEFDPQVPQYANAVGRPPDVQAIMVADLLARSYRDLTGKRPTLTNNYDGGAVSGQFLDFVSPIFVILGISYAVHYARKASGKLSGEK